MRAAAACPDGQQLRALVERARAGDSPALEQLVVALQHDVFRLAMRMTANAEDAEDATQEILIKVITRLDSFRGESSIRTWAYRIAVRHILDRRKGRVEALAMDFKRFGADLLDGLASDPDPDPLLSEEVKLGCTLAMLTCLDREHRLAFVLSDVFDLSNTEAAGLCDVADEVYRQRLSRARRVLEAFTRSYCGLVNGAAPCHCSRRVARAEALGRLHRTEPVRVRLHRERVDPAVREMENLHAAAAQLMRQHPRYLAPPQVLDRVRSAIRGSAGSLLAE